MRLVLLLFLALLCSSPMAQTLVTPENSPIVIYQTEDNYDDIKSNLETAIIDRGMIISSTLHISDMFERTGKDLGLTTQPYTKAESLEFCNVLLSHKMSSAHPANLAICPLTIGIYSKADAPQTIYLTYRRPVMLGEAAAAESALTRLLEEIIQESLE